MPLEAGGMARETPTTLARLFSTSILFRQTTTVALHHLIKLQRHFLTNCSLTLKATPSAWHATCQEKRTAPMYTGDRLPNPTSNILVPPRDKVEAEYESFPALSSATPQQATSRTTNRPRDACGFVLQSNTTSAYRRAMTRNGERCWTILRSGVNLRARCVR
jgi:hypothetical protein